MGDFKFAAIVGASMILSFLIVTTIKGTFASNERQKAQIHFTKRSHHFDTIRSPEEERIYFQFSNIGESPLVIRDMETSCGCTVPEWNSLPISAGEVDSFQVTYNTENKGYFLKEILIHTNSTVSPARISICGFVPFDEDDMILQ